MTEAVTAAGVDVSRVCELLVGFDSRSETCRGSGFLLSGGVVLTAWHVVADAESVSAVFNAGLAGVLVCQALSWQRVGDFDVALLHINGGPVAEPVVVGGFGDRGVVLSGSAIGYPRWKLRDRGSEGTHDADGRYRVSAQVPAEVVSGSNRRDGAVELIVAAPAADGGHSPWEGMSGGPLFCGDTLVGVVTDHFPREGLGRLSAVRLDACLLNLSDVDSTALCPLFGLESVEQIRSMGDVPRSARWAAYQQVVSDVAPRDGLHGREAELQAMAEFCAGSDAYVYWQGPARSGKTALMAWFALHPPTGVTVVSFFVTARLAGQSDSAAYLDALLDQLSALAGEGLPSLATPSARRAHARRMLTEVAAITARRGEQLVLLVDGLDEDTGSDERLPSIASLLPVQRIAALKVVVAGRPDPLLPRDVRGFIDHPLNHCARQLLSPSPYARGLMEAAEQELDSLLCGARLGVEVIELVAASGGGLTRADMRQLTGASQHELRRLLDGHAGRTIVVRTDARGEHGYLFTHESLRQSAERLIGDQGVAVARERIHSWADEHRRQGWPTHTPWYLLSRYQHVLEANGDIPRLVALAEDVARHDRMLALTGGDRLADNEIHAALRGLTDGVTPDLRAMARVGRRRAILRQRNRHVPSNLPAAWAAAGSLYFARAEALALSLTDPWSQMKALSSLAKVVAPVDSGYAGAIATQAEDVAHNILDPNSREEVLASLVEAVALFDFQRAERIARNIRNPSHRTKAFYALVKKLAATDSIRAEQFVDSSGESPFVVAQMLISVVESASPHDHHSRTQQLAARVEQILNAEPTPRWRDLIYSRLVYALAITDPTRAGQITDAIVNPRERVVMLAELMTAVAANDLRTAGQIAAHARQISDCLVDRNDWFWSRYATAYIVLHPAKAEQIVRALETPMERVDVLAESANALAVVDPQRAGELAEAAEKVARRIADPEDRADALAKVAKSLAVSHSHLAERVAAAINDTALRAEVLAELALAISDADPARAGRMASRSEAVARAVTDPEEETSTLIDLVCMAATRDPVRAGRIAAHAEALAMTITEEYERSLRLANLVTALATADIKRSKRLTTQATTIARTILDPEKRAAAFAELMFAATTCDPKLAGPLGKQAEHATRRIDDPMKQVKALALLVRATTAIDPKRAKRIAADAEWIAQDLEKPWQFAYTLVTLVEAVAALDITWAHRIAAQIADPDCSANASIALIRATGTADLAQSIAYARQAELAADDIEWDLRRRWALVALVEAMSSIDVDRALSLTRKIDAQPHYDLALAAVARAFAEASPERAEQIIGAISDPEVQAHLLMHMSGAAARRGRQRDADRLAAQALLDGADWEDLLSVMDPSIQMQAYDDLLQELDH